MNVALVVVLLIFLSALKDNKVLLLKIPKLRG